MANPQELEALTSAISGLGVDEKLMISILGKSNLEHKKSFRKANTHLFIEDEERSFEHWDDQRRIYFFRHEFVRFENAWVLWAMHPWERDARLIHESLKEGPQSYGVIVEVACTRTSEGLLGARKAYHSIFDHSVEEDIGTHIHGSLYKLLVALVSAYRYEGPKIKEETAKYEAETLALTIKSGAKLIEDDEVVRILVTRSKPHLNSIYKHYRDVTGKSITEDVGDFDLIFKQTIECLFTPYAYFSKVLDDAMRSDADHNTQNGLTRVITTRAEADLKEIEKEYNSLYGNSLAAKVESVAKGNYKDFLLSLIGRENE
ncbi:annexin D4-like [Euphorbia lathyris]|uniref:annexin D4-like n=1 Tax=Euphorbia lathyris TaxID=212925 RepID=UPI003313633E